jgi:LmbE family N-acetylglucosaminyl deacetylase
MSECLDATKLSNPAIVFAPHQDDEILGCGGTLIKKIQRGAEINLVFVTDGRRSHRKLISEDDIKHIRTQEALRAIHSMGLSGDKIHFLNFKSGELEKNLPSATRSVLNIIRLIQPEEIFVPYFQDTHFEHRITHKIVTNAIKQYEGNLMIYEYPVWYWHHWPWISLYDLSFKERIFELKKGFISLWYFFKDFRYSVCIGDIIDIKKRALDEYRSQMTRFISTPQWKTLPDVSNGEFLQSFFQSHEIFYRYSVPGHPH